MPWFRKSSLEPLAVSMSGIKLGDRLLVIGCDDTALIAALAGKAGLTGRACMVCASAEQRIRAAKVVEGDGALVESFDAQPTKLPFEQASFDVAVIRNLLPSLDPGSRSVTVAEVRRVIRPGGRCIVIDDAPRGGIARLIGGGRGDAGYGQYVQAGGGAGLLQGAGFRGVRTLAEREALVFVEGVKAVLS